MLVNGFAVFFEFNASDFLVAYINIPIFAVLYIGWKVYRRTMVWKPSEMDFITVRNLSCLRVGYALFRFD